MNATGGAVPGGAAGFDRGRPEPPIAKQEIRRAMRAARRAIDDRAERSVRLVDRLERIAVVGSARRMLLFTPIAGEPDVGVLARRSLARGVEVAVPEDERAPDWPDVVVVPGLAFTPTGERLGQGGGWYDRFLPARRPGGIAIGVGFDLQVVDRLPLEPHDVRLDAVVTESRTWWST